MFYLCSMSVETLGDAYAAGWRVLARCAGRGRIDGPTSRSSRECTYRHELDMESLVWTRGRDFPLARLEIRLRCPRCGGPGIVRASNRAQRIDPALSKGTQSMRSETWLAAIPAFTRAMVGDWLARMSGPLSVPATAAALWVTNDTAKILLGLTAFACLWVTAYRLWKSEHDKVVERDQKKRQLLDEISTLRETMVQYRIDMERDYEGQRFNQAAWQQKYDALEDQIAIRIELLTSKAEASTYRKRGNIPRQVRPGRPGTFQWDVLIDACIYDLDYLKTFIHDISRGRDRR